MSRLWKWIALAGGAIMIAMMAFNQNAISRIKSENAELKNSAVEAANLRTENNRAAGLKSGSGEAEQLRIENEELPGLRNEVRKLREQAAGVAELRKENERLEAVIRNGGAPGKPAFIKRESLTNAGFATPEATVQTLFWAMANGDMRRAMECRAGMTSEQIEAAAKEIEGRGDRLNEFQKLPGFRITEKKEQPDGSVGLGVQTSNSGVVMKLRFLKTEGGWKLKDGESWE